jgi:hypothetical protein
MANSNPLVIDLTTGKIKVGGAVGAGITGPLSQDVTTVGASGTVATVVGLRATPLNTNIATPTTGNVIAYGGGGTGWEASVIDLTNPDTVVAGPLNSQLLSTNGANNIWTNTLAPGSGNIPLTLNPTLAIGLNIQGSSGEAVEITTGSGNAISISVAGTNPGISFALGSSGEAIDLSGPGTGAGINISMSGAVAFDAVTSYAGGGPAGTVSNTGGGTGLNATGTTGPAFTASNNSSTNQTSSLVNSNGSTSLFVTSVRGGSLSTSAVSLIRFDSNWATNIGSITNNGSITAYTTSSDARLKKDVSPGKLGLADLMQLQVREYAMIHDTRPTPARVHGIIAQEALKTGVVPEAIHESALPRSASPKVDAAQATHDAARAAYKTKDHARAFALDVHRDHVRKVAFAGAAVAQAKDAYASAISNVANHDAIKPPKDAPAPVRAQHKVQAEKLALQSALASERVTTTTAEHAALAPGLPATEAAHTAAAAQATAARADFDRTLAEFVAARDEHEAQVPETRYGIDYGLYTPLLIASVQDKETKDQAKFAAMEARIIALEKLLAAKAAVVPQAQA